MDKSETSPGKEVDIVAEIPNWEAWADKATLEYSDYREGVDTDYRYPISEPAFGEGVGPIVCIDEAHFNYHTADGLFQPYASLLQSDGYRVTEFRSKLTAKALAECHVLLMANAQASSNTIGFGSPDSNWAYPHASALTRQEIDELISWIRDGGALFLIADHAPWPAAVADLASLLGVEMQDGYTFPMRGDTFGEILFGAPAEPAWRESIRALEERIGVGMEDRLQPALNNIGRLPDHAIARGRNDAERVDWVVTFTGQAFRATADWKPLLVLGQNAVTIIPTRWNIDDAHWFDGPIFPAGGDWQGGTRILDRGRVAILGEGAMCTAQFDDLDGELSAPLMPYGINASRASFNAQFCLNVMHWLSGLLDA